MNIQLVAQKLFSDARLSHDWDHTLRVRRLCERIAKAEEADMDVLDAAAFLHDAGRSLQDSSNGEICHAEYGVLIAEPIVRAMLLSDQQKENILHCIKTHRFRGNNVPQTLEAKVLFDADKLDSIGAIGVARAYLFAGEIGARLHNPDIKVEETLPYSADDTGFREYHFKLSKIKDRMLTSEGKRLALVRHGFMVEFFNQFILEYQGER